MKKTVTIGDLGTIITGKTPPTTNKNYYGDYAVFIKPTDISEQSKFTYVTEEMYSKLAAEKYESSLVPKGAICVPSIGTIGTKMTMTHCDCYTNQSINSIVCNDDFDNEYVYYLIKNFLPGLKAYNLGTASGREYVSKSNFEKIELEVEQDKEIQKRIGMFLSRYDSLIENYQKQIKLLEEAAQRLYKEWFIDLHFPGHENTKIVDGVPEGWEKKKVREIGKVITGKTPSTAKKEYYGGQIPFITIPDMHTGIYPTSSQFLSDLGANSQSGKFIPANSLMVSCIGTAGLVCITKEECQTNQQINSLVLNDNSLLYYMYNTFLSLKEHLYNIGSNGATMTNVNKSKFESIEILIPNNSISNLYNKAVEQSFRGIKTLSSQIRLLTEARDRLLPKLMSGEIKVS
jgi:type I restriction enzyme S subunit